MNFALSARPWIVRLLQLTIFATDAQRRPASSRRRCEASVLGFTKGMVKADP
jgi:hypothetical protein